MEKTIIALQNQKKLSEQWEIIVVDNHSSPPVQLKNYDEVKTFNIKSIQEKKLGLTHARCAGIREASGEIILFVDDDNVLNRDYIHNGIQFLAQHPKVGAIGGKIEPEFEGVPESWVQEFYSLLALRDLGEQVLIAEPFVSKDEKDKKNGRCLYPDFAPVGAGMMVRKKACLSWMEGLEKQGVGLPDRQGNQLSSAGDNDLVFHLLLNNWQVAYLPKLSLTHLIPQKRLTKQYLALLNHNIRKSWVQVLFRHHASPWPAISFWSVPLRKVKAWFTYQAWRSPAHYIRWRGACGHFEGSVQ